MLVCNVNPRAETYARSVHEQLFAANIDAELDASDHTLGKKVPPINEFRLETLNRCSTITSSWWARRRLRKVSSMCATETARVSIVRCLLAN
jgi:hypothetical protein